MSEQDPRLAALRHWLQARTPTHGLRIETLRPVSGDASFRRYFRLDTQTGPSVIVMDAPPGREDCRPFVDVAGRLARAGVQVPAILEQDLEQGFLLLSDLGDHTYYQRLTTGLDVTARQTLYQDTIGALVTLQGADCQGLPVYSRQRMVEEFDLFPQWYIERHCGHTLSGAERAMLDQLRELLATTADVDRPVLVHRDFHSPNLMDTRGVTAGPNPGVIDFQDALAGPITYDLASWVMDARFTWEEPEQLDWAIRYWDQARQAGLPVPDDFAVFHRDYEWMSLQRNLRILGVFARLSLRDGKPSYLNHMPRVYAYVMQVASHYDAFGPLRRLLHALPTPVAPQQAGA